MVEIRQLAPTDDFRSVGCVYERSWKYSYQGILPQAFLDRLTPERFSSALRAEPEKTLVLYEDGIPAGACTMAYSRIRAGCGEVVSLYLLPEKMGKGYGRMLVEAALECFREDGCSEVCLWVFEENENAMHFYERLGFSLTGCVQTETYAGENVKMLEMMRGIVL